MVIGVDRSPEGLEAARQAGTLAEGRVVLVAAYDVGERLGGGIRAEPAGAVDEGERALANVALERARAELGTTASAAKIARGPAWEALLGEAAEEGASLIAVGSHGLARAAGIVLGSTATHVVHKASCSVLVARAAEESFPRSIVVGVDGSPESAAAYEVAHQLRERFPAELTALIAHGGKDVDPAAVDAIVVDRREDRPDRPVRALVESSGDADLVVLGTRNLSGLKVLGSVSERVAHQARCSVLVVRATAAP